MKYKLILSLIIILVISCNPENGNSQYRIVYKNDKNGNVLKGSKQKLIKFIRGGADIKIGWGTKGQSHSIEHLSEPIWIAVLDESEVVAHLDPQVLSKTDWNNLSANYADSTLLSQEWRVVITTKGEFDAVWYDRKNGNVVQRRPQSHIISWFAKGNHSSESLFSNLKE